MAHSQKRSTRKEKSTDTATITSIGSLDVGRKRVFGILCGLFERRSFKLKNRILDGKIETVSWIRDTPGKDINVLFSIFSKDRELLGKIEIAFLVRVSTDMEARLKIKKRKGMQWKPEALKLLPVPIIFAGVEKDRHDIIRQIAQHINRAVEAEWSHIRKHMAEEIQKRPNPSWSIAGPTNFDVDVIDINTFLKKRKIARILAC